MAVQFGGKHRILGFGTDATEDFTTVRLTATYKPLSASEIAGGNGRGRGTHSAAWRTKQIKLENYHDPTKHSPQWTALDFFAKIVRKIAISPT